MIHGAHVILYSKNAEADRAFFRDILEYDSVDAGGGWLIFALPPAEVAVHPSDGAEKHELYLMCDDVDEFIETMKSKKVRCSAVHEERWGLLTSVTLPGGGKIGVYQPLHKSPLTKGAGAKAGKTSKTGKTASATKAPAKTASKAAPKTKLPIGKKGTPAKQAFASAKNPLKTKGVPKK